MQEQLSKFTLADCFALSTAVSKTAKREKNILIISYDRVVTKTTQVNRMSRFRRVLAIGGKQRILRLDMVCIETILIHLDSL